MSITKLISPISALLICTLLIACGSEEEAKSSNEKFEQIFIFDSIKSVYSENSKVMMERDVVKLITKENGDEAYPKGIVMRRFDEKGILAATIVADSGYYDKSQEKMRLRGNVKVVNIEKGETLETPLLNWERGKKEIYSDTIVTIKAEGATTYGKGLTAKQDFSSYELSEISSSPDAFEESTTPTKSEAVKEEPITEEAEDLNFDF